MTSSGPSRYSVGSTVTAASASVAVSRAGAATGEVAAALVTAASAGAAHCFLGVTKCRYTEGENRSC
jgi:hypothetical protein